MSPDFNKISLYIFAIIFSLFLSGSSSAQEENESTERVKKIKLEKYDFKKLSATAVPFSKINVVPSLWDSTSLGFVQVGLGNKKIRAVPGNDYTHYLQSYIDSQYSDMFSPGGAELLFIVKSLRINERTFSMSENAFVRLNAVAWISKKDSNLYSFVCNFDTVLLTGGMDVTARHGRNIAKAFDLLLKKCVENNGVNGTDSAFRYSRQEILAAADDRFNIPALKNEMMNDGVYVSFDDFLNNNPSIKDYNVKEKKKKATIFAAGSNTELTPWGICRQGEVYKYMKGHLVAIERNDNSYIISDYLDNIKRRNKGILWGAIIGGVAGGAIGGAVGSSIGSSSGTIFYVGSIPYINKEPEASAIDMETGKFTF